MNARAACKTCVSLCASLLFKIVTRLGTPKNFNSCIFLTNCGAMGLEIKSAFYARPSAQREMLIRNFEIGNQ